MIPNPFAKKDGPVVLRNVRRTADRDETTWACGHCGTRFQMWSSDFGSGTPVRSPTLNVEVPAWRAAGLTREQYEKEVLATQRGRGFAGLNQVPTTCYISFCNKCTPQAQELRRRLQAESQGPAIEIHGGYHAEAIQRHMATMARLFGLPDYIAVDNWKCVRCSKSVNAGETRNPEQPALSWIVPAVSNQLGQVTAGPVTASLCARCAPIVDREARQSYQTNRSIESVKK